MYMRIALLINKVIKKVCYHKEKIMHVIIRNIYGGIDIVRTDQNNTLQNLINEYNKIILVTKYKDEILRDNTYFGIAEGDAYYDPIVILCGKELDLQKTLEENNIYHESTLRLNQRIKPKYIEKWRRLLEEPPTDR